MVKNYVRGTVRGFTVVQFNLINPMKTDIYNPLSLAADAARDGNSTKCAMYVENIAEVFFPLDGGEDPLWPSIEKQRQHIGLGRAVPDGLLVHGLLCHQVLLVHRIRLPALMDYLKANHLVGMQCLWDAFEDPDFTKPMKGKDFMHEDTVSREGWARCFFKGCFPNDKAYLRLRIRDTGSEMLVKTFFFEFQKDYQTSYDGKTYMKDPILGTRIVKNGFLTELVKVRGKDGAIKYRPAPTTFMKPTVKDIVATAQKLTRGPPDPRSGKSYPMSKSRSSGP